MRCLLPLVYTTLGVLLTVTGSEALAAHHALLIGISEYASAGLTDLPGAMNDLDLMKQVLRSRLGLREEEIVVLRNRQATRTGVRQALAALADRVQPGDSVYLYYSGHGSRMDDQNGDERERGGKDQTLVGWGARVPGSAGDDRFDILDDELNAWLGPIAARAGEFVAVFDSCHSATVTRGADAPTSRAAPAADQSDHPAARKPPPDQDLRDMVRIGAARDDQQAIEWQPDEEPAHRHGLFTWHWASALTGATPTDTWRRVFERAAWVVSAARAGQQQPQITGGSADRPLLGGRLDARPALMVTAVDRSRVRLDAARLDGVTVGSRYANSDTQDAAWVRITDVPLVGESQGQVERGSLKVGDHLFEREHAFITRPLKLFVLPPADPDDAKALADARERLAPLPGYEWVGRQDHADLILTELRPRRIGGLPDFSKRKGARLTLPETDPTARREIWVLTPEETPLGPEFQLPLDTGTDATEKLRRNLDRLRKISELRRFAAETGGNQWVRLGLIPFQPCVAGDPSPATGPGPADQDGCIPTLFPGLGLRRGPSVLPAADLRSLEIRQNDRFSFELENVSPRERYAWLLEIAADGAVAVLFPTHNLPSDTARLKPGQRLDLSSKDLDQFIRMDPPGSGAVVLLTTGEPMDPYRLTQSGYEPARGTVATPVEELLGAMLQGGRGVGTRGERGGGPSPGSVDVAVFDFMIAPAATTQAPEQRP